MHCRIMLACGAICALALALPARAQIASTQPAPGSQPGWSFALTPYVWLPTISADLQANGPRGGSVSTNISAGFGDYISDINFATMLGGVARYDRFSIMTDLVYMNASLTSDVSRLSTVNIGSGPIDIPRSTQVNTGTRLAATVWSLAGGYTLLQGDWGNVDVVAGLRMLSVGSTTNYTLSHRHPRAGSHDRLVAYRQLGDREVVFQCDRGCGGPHQHSGQQILPALLLRCWRRRITVHLASLRCGRLQRRELARCVGWISLPELPTRG